MQEIEGDFIEDDNFEFFPEVEYSYESFPNNQNFSIKHPFFRSHFFSYRYSDFQTIDWLKERTNARFRSLYYKNHLYLGFWIDKLKYIYEKISAVIILTLIGIFCAYTSFTVSIGVHYFSDLREGFCVSNFFYNHRECCWSLAYDNIECSDWKSWANVFGETSNSSHVFFINFLFYTLISMTLSFLSVSIVFYIAPYASGGGISEIKLILSGFVMKGFLGISTYIFKTAALIFSAASGLLLGQEGPMVHITCCIANFFIRLFPKYRDNEAKKREIILASTAVGVACAFNSPIAGVLFSLEETSFYFTSKTLWKSFYASLIGILILTSLIPYYGENIVLYSVTSADWHFFEIPIFVVIGTLGGLYGALFTKLTLAWSRLKQKMKISKYPILEVIIVSLVTCLLSFPFEFSKMSNHHLISRMFKSCIYHEPNKNYYCKSIPKKITNFNPYSEESAIYIFHEIKWVVLALIIKMTLLIFSFGIKVPYGLFIPSIVLGSLSGRVFGLTLEYLSVKYSSSYIFSYFCAPNKRCIYPSLYAVVSGAAVLGGITQMTVCVVVMMVEITGKLSYILPLILAVTFSKWVSNALLKNGLYEQLSDMYHYPYLSNKDEISVPISVLDGFSITRKNNLVTLNSEGLSISSICEILKESKYSGYPIVNADSLLIGYVTYSELNQIIQKKIFGMSDTALTKTTISFTSNHKTLSLSPSSNKVINLRNIVDRSPIVIHPRASLNSAIYIFQKLGVSQIVIVEKGIPIGIITRKDIIIQINKLNNE